MIFFRIKLLSAIFILFTLTTLQNLYSQDYPESLDQKKYNFLHNYTLSFNLIGGLGGIKGDLIEIEKDSVEYEEMDANGKIQKKNPDCNPYYYGFITDFYPLTYTNLKLGIRGKISRTKIRKEATISGTFGKKHIKKTLMRYNSYMLGVVSIWTPFNNQNIGLLSFFNYGFIYNGNLTPFPGLLEQNEDSLPKKKYRFNGQNLEIGIGAQFAFKYILLGSNIFFNKAKIMLSDNPYNKKIVSNKNNLKEYIFEFYIGVHI